MIILGNLFGRAYYFAGVGGRCEGWCPELGCICGPCHEHFNKLVTDKFAFTVLQSFHAYVQGVEMLDQLNYVAFIYQNTRNVAVS